MAAWRWCCLLLVALLVLPATVVVALVGFPRVDRPTTSDVILVVGPSWPDRLAYATRLMDEGRAKALVVSAHPWDTGGTPPALCRHGGRRYPVYCFDPVPSTTQGEARALTRLARRHGWRSVQVITFRPHVERTRMVVGRCFDGPVRVLRSPESYNPVAQGIYHVGAFPKSLLQPGC